MKLKQTIALLAVLTTLALASQTNAQTTNDVPVSLPRSSQFDLTSGSGLTYRVFVAEPTATAPKETPADGYATYFILDANAMFATTVEAVRFQKNLVPTLIVGIGYPEDLTQNIQRRYHDFTPVTPDEHIWTSGTEPRAKPENTGGQDEFLAFIEQQVRPELAKRYKLDPSRSVLAGHSLGGRLVLHAMFTRPQMFTHYVAMSPSIWWDDRSILKEADAFLAARSTDAAASQAPVALLMTAAELEQRSAPGTSAERTRFFEMAKMVDNARQLSDRLEKAQNNGVTVRFIEFAEENHGSVVPAAISRSMRFALQASPKSTGTPANTAASTPATMPSVPGSAGAPRAD